MPLPSPISLKNGDFRVGYVQRLESEGMRRGEGGGGVGCCVGLVKIKKKKKIK